MDRFALVVVDLEQVASRNYRRRAFIDNYSILYANDALGMARDIVIVSNNDNGDAFLLVEPLQNAQNILCRARIQVASRLVCEQDRRPVYERTRDGDALLFAARHLRRFVVHAIAQADESQKFSARCRRSFSGT